VPGSSAGPPAPGAPLLLGRDAEGRVAGAARQAPEVLHHRERGGAVLALRRLAELLGPAIHYARDGFPLSSLVSQAIDEYVPVTPDPEWHRVFAPQGRAPAPGALFAQPGVASVQPVGSTARVFRDLIDDFLGILGIVQLAVVGLALLIAFNSASISADERARENATMFAFGVPVRTVLRMAVVEGLVIGLIGTVVGLGLGRIVLQWLVDVLLPGTIPDITVSIALSAETFAKAFGMGVVAVGLAPLLTARRLMRMDVPSTLRVVE